MHSSVSQSYLAVSTIPYRIGGVNNLIVILIKFVVSTTLFDQKLIMLSQIADPGHIAFSESLPCILISCGKVRNEVDIGS